MQMIAIIGAVVSGIVMWIGNTNYKKGAAWGQPVAIAFGVIAIAMGIWAMTLNGGNAGAVNKEIGYQKVRAEKLGKYIAANFADKKIQEAVSALGQFFVKPVQCLFDHFSVAVFERKFFERIRNICQPVVLTLDKNGKTGCVTVLHIVRVRPDFIETQAKALEIIYIDQGGLSILNRVCNAIVL